MVGKGRNAARLCSGAEGVPRPSAAVELVPRVWAVGRREDDHQEMSPPMMAKVRTDAVVDRIFLHSMMISRGLRKYLEKFLDEIVGNPRTKRRARKVAPTQLVADG